MIIKLFNISKYFFDLMYSPFIEDVLENDVIRVKQDKEKGWQELSDDEEKGWQELSDDEEWEEDICGYNLCHTTRQLILFINPGIYKKLNANKVD